MAAVHLDSEEHHYEETHPIPSNVQFYYRRLVRLRLSLVMKLLLDLSRAGGGTCPWRGCLSSISCLNFSVLVFTSLRISGGAIPASRYSDGSGVGRRLPVTMRQALFNSELTFFAWQDFPHTGQQN